MGGRIAFLLSKNGGEVNESNPLRDRDAFDYRFYINLFIHLAI